MHIHGCVELGSVAFDLFLWGEKDGICVFGKSGGGGGGGVEGLHGTQGTF